MWAFTPELGQDIFWLSGAVNYLLPMLPIMGLICIYRCHFEKPFSSDKIPRCIIITIIGILAGWSLENSGITVPVIAGLYMLLYRKHNRKIPKWAICGFIGAVLGYAALIIAPGNFKRRDIEIQSVSLSLPFKLAVITYYWIIFAGVLTAVFIAASIICIRKGKKTQLWQGLIFAVAALVSAYCMIAAPSSPERTWFITIALMTAADGILLKAVIPETGHTSIKAVFCAAALIILGTMAADTMLASYDIRNQFAERKQIILEEKSEGKTVIEIPVYSLKYPFKANRYALYGLYDVELGENAPNSFNKAIADYYGVEALIGI